MCLIIDAVLAFKTSIFVHRFSKLFKCTLCKAPVAADYTLAGNASGPDEAICSLAVGRV